MDVKKYTPLRAKKIRHLDWSDEERILIEAVQRYPCIYDPNMHQRFRPLKTQCWQDVSLETGLPVTKCKKRWSSIRRSYVNKMLAIYRNQKLKKTKFIDGTLSFLEKETLKRIDEGIIKRETPKRKKNTSTSEAVASFQTDSEEEMTEEACTEDSNSSPLTATSNYNANQSRSNPGTTVLTQDIIEYLLKARNEDVSKKEDDIFQSMASFVSDSLAKPSIICSGPRTLSTVPAIAVSAGIESNIKNTASIIEEECNKIAVPENEANTTLIKEECKAFPVLANELTPDDSDNRRCSPSVSETKDEEISDSEAVIKTEFEIEIDEPEENFNY